MKKFALSIASAALLMVGCSDATQLEMAQDDVREAQQDVLDERNEAANEVAGEVGEGRDEVADEVAEGREEVADAVDDLRAEQEDLAHQRQDMNEELTDGDGEERSAAKPITPGADGDAVEEVEID